MNNDVKNNSKNLNDHQNTAPEWSKYASQFDEMCDLIPAYQDNIDALISAIPDFDLPPNPRICDLGAGTGNFVIAMNNVLPGATFTHVDLDPIMNETARAKYGERGIDATVVENYIQRLDFDPNSFDLIVCVNALCHAAPQEITLRRMKEWLKDDGTLFVIDFGRPVRLMDWGWYIFSNAVNRVGFLNYLRALVRNRETFIQNRRAKKGQAEGAMWTHTKEEFESVITSAGFDLIVSKPCYRGYCDMAICKPQVEVTV